MTKEELAETMTEKQSQDQGQSQGQVKHSVVHCGVDEVALFDGWATAGGSKLHKITFSPRVLGPEDVEIKILYCGICGSDIHMMEEDWCKLHDEVVPGHEITGKVSAAGPEAIHQVGDCVGATLIANSCLECEGCKAGYEQLCRKKVLVYKDRFKDECPAPSYGGFADRIRLNSKFVYKIPDEIPLDEAAPLMCAGVTVYTALRRCGADPTKVVGIKGIGNLGHLSIQLARAFCAKEVIAISDSPIDPQDALSLGATEVMDFTNPEHHRSIRRKIDIMLVNSFDKSTDWNILIAMMANRGIMVNLAISKEPIRIPTMDLVHRQLKVTGSFQGGRKDVRDMLMFVAQHQIHPWIAKFPFDEINEAIEVKKQGTARYAIVLEAVGQEPAIPKEEKSEKGDKGEMTEKPEGSDSKPTGDEARKKQVREAKEGKEA